MRPLPSRDVLAVYARRPVFAVLRAHRLNEAHHLAYPVPDYPVPDYPVKAWIPVCARPRISAWMSWVPS